MRESPRGQQVFHLLSVSSLQELPSAYPPPHLAPVTLRFSIFFLVKNTKPYFAAEALSGALVTKTTHKQ